MYTLLREDQPPTRVLVMHLRGWIDAGSAAAMAMDAIAGQLELEPLAVFDDDELIDYRSRRPTMRLDDGLLTELEWPSITLDGGRAVQRNVLVLRGAEPDRHWRSFATSVVDLAEQHGVQRILGLGAFPGPAPHTRPTQVVSTASSRELADAIGHNDQRMEVPSGVQAAIEVEAAARGIEAATIWAPVPHYVATMDFPGASAALVEAVALHGGLELDAGTLHEAAAVARERIDGLIAANPDHLEMLRALEARAEEMEANRSMDVPDADALAAEIEDFLRSED